MSIAFIEFARSARDQIYYLIRYHRRYLKVRGVELILHDPAISRRMFYVLCHGYEYGEADMAERYLHADDRVLEVGGGIGFLALICTMHIGITHYWLIEANPDLIPVIHKNLEINEMSDVGIGVRNAVLTSYDGLAEFNVHRNFWSSSIVPRPGRTKKVHVPAQTLSALVEEMPFRPNVLIMDIEGGEADIDPNEFAIFSKILMELHPRIIGRAKVDALVRSLIGMGFENPHEGVFLRHHVDPAGLTFV